MKSFMTYLAIVFLTGTSRVQCDGQFFQITKDNLPMTLDKPVLTTDVFECSREKACKTLVRYVKSKGEDVEVNKVAFSITKSTG